MWYSASQEPLNIGRTFAYSHMCRPNMPKCPSEKSPAYCIWTGPSIPSRKDQLFFGDNLQVHFKPLQRAVIFNVWGLKDERPEWQDSAFLLCTDKPACSNVNEQSNSCNILQQNGIKLTLDHEPLFLQGSVDVVRSLVAWFAYRKSRSWGPLDPLLSYDISTCPVAGLWAPFRPGPGRQLLSRKMLLYPNKNASKIPVLSPKNQFFNIWVGITSHPSDSVCPIEAAKSMLKPICHLSMGCASGLPCGYGSIPINTIFRGMNIHLPAILMFSRGTRFWHTAIFSLVKRVSSVATKKVLGFLLLLRPSRRCPGSCIRLLPGGLVWSAALSCLVLKKTVNCIYHDYCMLLYIDVYCLFYIYSFWTLWFRHVQTSFKSHGCLLDVSAFAFQVSKCSLIISILFESLRYELNVWEGCISMCFAIVETCWAKRLVSNATCMGRNPFKPHIQALGNQ